MTTRCKADYATSRAIPQSSKMPPQNMHPAFAPCVHMTPGRVFAPATVSSSAICSRARPRMSIVQNNRASNGAEQNETNPSDPAARTGNRWEGVRRVVRMSAVSLSVLLCSIGGGAAAAGAPGGGGQVRVPRDSASDVEAAAVTLGAVTVGGLVMRAVLASRRDEDKEREKLAAECARLEQEEILRARRLKRKAMERVDEAEDLPEDDDLRSSLMKRLQGLDSDDGDDLDDANGDGKKKFMRNSPIPDRGTGSMLLERPDDTVGESDQKANEEEATVNPDELEMLNRMWNLNSPDNEDRTS